MCSGVRGLALRGLGGRGACADAAGGGGLWVPWVGAEDEALDAGEVGEEAEADEAVLGGDVCDGLCLVVADFEGDAAAGVEVGGGGGEEAADDVHAIGAAIEGGDGVAPDFAREAGDLGAGDVGEVGDDEVEPGGDFFKKVAAGELDVAEAEAGGIEPGEIEGVFGDVGELGAGVFPGGGEGEADAAGTGGDVEEGGGPREVGGGDLAEEPIDEVFGLGTGYEGAVV